MLVRLQFGPQTVLVVTTRRTRFTVFGLTAATRTGATRFLTF